MTSPVTLDHGITEGNASTWLGVYQAATPGTEKGHNTTSFLLEDTPQPDIFLRLRPEYGGLSWVEGKYLHGVPELLVEVCSSSAAYDLHVKLDLYQAAKVPEYLAILLFEQEIRWHVLVDDAYQMISPGADGIWRSRIFPGLWLDGKALLARETALMLAKVQEGIQSPEHQVFVERLTRAKQQM